MNIKIFPSIYHSNMQYIHKYIHINYIVYYVYAALNLYTIKENSNFKYTAMKIKKQINTSLI